MRVCFGDRLWTRDGQEAGTVEWFLIDPQRLRVNALVIRRGLILRHSLVVPLDAIAREETGTRLILRYTSRELDQLPEFHRELYTGQAAWQLTGERASPFFIPGWLPPASLYEPPPPSPEVIELGEIVRTIDQANAVLHRGATVITAEGERVAHLHDLCAEIPGGRLLHVRVRYGLPPHDLDIPVDVVSSADDGVLCLRWWRDEFERAAHGATGTER